MRDISKEQDNKEWGELYEYVRSDILEYKPTMQIPKFMILRLRGLRKGKFIANKNQKPRADYTYNEILLTFKACRHDILKYTRRNVFEDEQHRFNYIMVVIENNINDIVLRLENAKRHDERVESVDVSHIKRDVGAQYQRKTEDKNNKRLEDLW